MSGPKNQSAKSTRSAPVQVLPPAVVVDATYLHGLARCTRSAISEGILPMLLDQCVEKAKRGQMEMLFIPSHKECDIAPLTLCEALQPGLNRLGITTEIRTMERQRLGMTDSEIVMAISWREVRA